ncbi:Uncharacterised protein [Serratia fonticola]|nr:Uncharacterised protein [Serratia fonticola]
MHRPFELPIFSEVCKHVARSRTIAFTGIKIPVSVLCQSRMLTI